MRKPALILLVLLLLSTAAFSATFFDQVKSLKDFATGLVGIGAMILILTGAVVYVIAQFLGTEMRARATVYATNLVTATLIGFIAFAVLGIFIDGVQSYLTAGALPAKLTVPQVTFIIVALSFGAATAALFYFAAYALQHPPLIAVAKEEVAALFVSIVIIFAWTFTNGLMHDVTMGLLCMGSNTLCASAGAAGSNFATHADIAYGSLDILYNKLKTFYVHLYLFEILIGFLSTVNFPLGSPFPGVNLITFSFTPFAGLTMISNAHTIIVEAIGYTMTFVIAKQFILDFARLAVPTILFPVGITMRAFPWFRTTGSSIIAMCIVLYYVYPLAILFTNYLIFDVYKPSDFTYVPEVSTLIKDGKFSDLKGEVKEADDKSKELLNTFKDNSNLVSTQVDKSSYKGIFGGVQDFLSSAYEHIKGFFGTVFNIAKFMFGFGGNIFLSVANSFLPIGAAGGLYRFVIHEVINIGQFVALVVFTSFIEIVITVTMYRNIAAMIGGEVEIAGLSKLV